MIDKPLVEELGNDVFFTGSDGGMRSDLQGVLQMTGLHAQPAMNQSALSRPEPSANIASLVRPASLNI